MALLCGRSVVGRPTKTRQTIDQYGRKWWRFLSGPYRKSQARVSTLFSQAAPTDATAQLSALDAITEAQQERAAIGSYEPVGTQLYGQYWSGGSGFGRASAKNELAGACSAMLQRLVPAEIVPYLTTSPDRQILENQVRDVEDALSAQEAIFEKVTRILDPVPSQMLGDGAHLDTVPFQAQQRFLGHWAANAGSIITLATYNNLVKKCLEAGLQAYVDPDTG